MARLGFKSGNMSMSTTDPMFQLGLMLGQGYADIWHSNAKKRQTKQAQEEYERMQAAGAGSGYVLDHMQNEADVKALANQPQSVQQAAVQGNMPSTDFLNNNKYDVGAGLKTNQPAQVSAKDRAINAIEAGINNQAIQNIRTESAARTPEQRAGLIPDAEKRFRAYANKKGMYSDVYDKVLGEIKQDQSRKADAFYQPQIYRGLYGYKDEKGNWVAPTNDTRLQAMQLASEYAKYNPDSAKAFMGAVHNQFSRQQQLADQKELISLRGAANIARDTNRAINRFTYNTNTKGAGGVRGNAYDPTKVANAGKRIQEIDAYIAEGGQLTPSLRQEYNAHRQYLDSVYGGGTPQGNETTVSTQGDGNTQPKQKTSDFVRGIFDSIDFGNFDDDSTIADGKKFTFDKGTQAAVDAMRKAGANNDQIFKAIDSTLAEKEAKGELPPGYREAFAHSMERKTQKELNDEAIEAKRKRDLELDMTLHPEKYGIDSFGGVKYVADAIANGKPLFDLAGNTGKAGRKA